MAFIKGLFYHILLWLRWLFKIGFKIIGGLCFLYMIIALFSKTWIIAFIMGGFSFICYLLSHYYDRLILWCAPDNENISLFS